MTKSNSQQRKRSVGRLSAAKLEKAKPGLHGDGGNLYLLVDAGGGRSWIFRYRFGGRRRDLGLGPVTAVGLAQARDLAIDARRLLAAGIDPIEHRKTRKTEAKIEAAKATTFGEFAKIFIDGKAPGWRNSKHSDQWRMTLLGIVPSKIKGEADKPAKHDYCKAIRELPIGAIDTAAILKVLIRVWQKRPETATRIRSRIENVLDAAKVAGLREGENPARWKGGLQHLLPARVKIRKVAHQPALPYMDVPAFVRELRQGDGIAAACLEFQILTTVRPGNAVRCRWEQVDRKAQTWTIPAGDMKGGDAHLVPLSDAALAVLDRMAKIKHSDFVFPSTMGRGAGAQRRLGHLSDNALASVIDRLNAKDKRWIDPTSGREIVPHGFRSAFRDWGAETDAAPDPVLEACLAHKVSDAVVAAYRRTKFEERRRHVMQAWARYIDAEPSGQVVPLHKQPRV